MVGISHKGFSSENILSIKNGVWPMPLLKTVSVWIDLAAFEMKGI